ncbi:hypothetical protein COS81_01560 [candidate division WWE3 bacterium CG06_land_8_20_14_3_00_42_16]|uniref:Zinc finger DksA/TraR C4-type domain-containing protein n=1 Tax=candidate division WWE3 bacterium CG06_land_8_20_14_3_00_42_16 TaxID=1975083 RepID=A0A2M7ANP6_UNCKA|nr:MAG: hypothetical protein COS81_01560 [candidate division WWE3 bacterium CG06_land_8_20_14_3_00_42_16]
MSTSFTTHNRCSCGGHIRDSICDQCGAEFSVEDTEGAEAAAIGDGQPINIMADSGPLETVIAEKLEALRPKIAVEAKRILETEAALLQRSCEILRAGAAETRDAAAADNGEVAALQATAERIGLNLALCQQQLQVVSGALYRMIDRVWGVCTRCGRKIDLLRLIADPALELCLDCAQKKERTARKPAKKRRR